MSRFEPPDYVRMPPRVSFDYPMAFAMRVDFFGAFILSQRVVFVDSEVRLVSVEREDRSVSV